MTESKTTPNPVQTIALGLLGAAIGGWVGYMAMQWILRQGFHAIVVPPALLGWTAGLFARQRCVPLAILCGVAGLALGIFCEWHLMVHFNDGSFSYFITHIYQLKPLILGLLALGTFVSYRLALGRDKNSQDQ